MGHQYMKALRKTLKKFCKETSVPGFRYLVDSRRTWFERCIWFLLQLFLFAAVLKMILFTFEGAFEEPLVTSLETVGYPIENIDFPGISICNINKISKKRAIEYARMIAVKGNLPFDDVLKKIKMLGKFYDYEINDVSVSELLTIQTYLEQYGIISNGSDNSYLHHIMKNLSTPCEELFYKCYWKGKTRNCSEIFALSRTYEGFCCTFNYDGYDNSIETSFQTSQEPEFLSSAGVDVGLTVVVRNEPDDYFYPLISSIGINVHIFNPLDYPDSTSGGLIQILISIATENFLDLHAKTVYSVPEVKTYPIIIRNCIFPNEIKTPFGTYSLSNCLVACRVQSILALCKCVPFIIPWYLNASPCSLPDIPCLNKYQGKWQNFYPYGYESDELEYEKQNSLRCENCYAQCSGTQYSVFTSWAHLNNQGPGSQKYENFSVIRIYYGSAYTKLYRQDVLYYWFEILSNVGGVMSIFLGISLMSVIEFLYFITFRFYLILKRSKM